MVVSNLLTCFLYSLLFYHVIQYIHIFELDMYNVLPFKYFWMLYLKVPLNFHLTEEFIFFVAPVYNIFVSWIFPCAYSPFIVCYLLFYNLYIIFCTNLIKIFSFSPVQLFYFLYTSKNQLQHFKLSLPL